PARVVAIAVGLAILAFAGALAAPRVVATLPARGGTIVLCVDTSGSMRATDVEPSRADAAANAVRAFVDGVPDGTRLGIVAFSSAAGVVIPPTREKDAVRDAIDRIPPPNGGTAIGDALAAAAGDGTPCDRAGHGRRQQHGARSAQRRAADRRGRRRDRYRRDRDERQR